MLLHTFVISINQNAEQTYHSIRQSIVSAQHKLSAAVNYAMVITYWEIGEQIYKVCGENDRAIAHLQHLRKRDVPVLFWVSAEELELIRQKMQQYGTENLSAYLRKMAVDGYVVQLDLPELKELVSLMRYSSNNLNQLTRKVHETGRVYDADLEDISQRQEQLWEGVKEILTQLSKLS